MYELVGRLGPSVQSGRSPKLISSPAQPAPELVQRRIRVGLAIQLLCEPTFPGGEHAAAVAGQSSPFFGVFRREPLGLGGELLKACLFDGCPGPVEVFSATDGGRPTELCACHSAAASSVFGAVGPLFAEPGET